MYCSKCGQENADSARFCADCGSQLSSVSKSDNTHQTINADSQQIRYGGFWIRVLAALIDGLLSQIVSIILVLPLALALGASMAETSSMEEVEAAGQILGFVLGIFIQWLWFTIAESSKWQASIGKKMLGLKVVDVSGNRIGFGKANARYWSKIISAILLLVGFLMVAFTNKKQGLHDKIAGTFIIRRNP